jgi:fumarate reductase flavoprotein subunit
VYRADSLDDLANLTGISPEGLKTTVDEYNAMLARSDPDPYGRTYRPAPIVEPPFFALENHGITLISFAGVDVDGNLAVRREDGSVIEGLYAVGEVFGAGVTSGNSFCGGMMVTPALALGRWLGSALGAQSR